MNSPRSYKRLRRRTPRRVLIAKLGLDGHDRGIKVIAQALRDNGYEVIYTGLFQTTRAVARAAVQEDVHLVAISILSGAHRVLLPRVMGDLKRMGGGNIPVVGGGIIAAEEGRRLRRRGLREVFGPGTPVRKIVAFIDRELASA